MTEDSFPFVCRTCKARFRDGGAVFVRHLDECSGRNAERLQNANPANAAIFDPDNWDGDLERWTEQHAEEIIEGRKKL